MNKSIKFLVICVGLCGQAKAAENDDLNGVRHKYVGSIIYPEKIEGPIGKDTARIIGIKSIEQRNGQFSDVYFVLERLTDLSKKTWRSFTDHQSARRVENDQADGARNGFIRALERYGKIGQEEIWVAYAASKNPNEESLSFCPRSHPGGTVKSYIKSDIEMVVSVFMSESAPVTTHMGIFRNNESMGNKKAYDEAHKNLAIELQSFAAKASKLTQGEKYIMVTTPLDVMRKMILSSLGGRPNQIWVGDEKNRLKQRAELEKIERAISDLADLEDNLENEKNSGHIDFTFFEKPPFSDRLNESTKSAQINDYIKEKSIPEIRHEIKTNSSNLWSQSHDMLVDIVSQLNIEKQTMCDADGKLNILYLLKKACIDQMRKDFVANRKKIEQDTTFLPKFQKPSILDNTTTQFVLTFEGKKISFPQPNWFICLQGSVKLTVMTSLDALQSNW